MGKCKVSLKILRVTITKLALIGWGCQTDTRLGARACRHLF